MKDTNMNKLLIYSLCDKARWTHPNPDIQNNRPDDTYYMAELFIGEENGRPVKETFENLMHSALESWKNLCELFAALSFYACSASDKKNESLYNEYTSCMNIVMDKLYEKYDSDWQHWHSFVD